MRAASRRPGPSRNPTQQSCYLVRDANEQALAYVLSQRQPWLSSRRGCAADDLPARIVLIEVTISEAQPRDRAAEPAMVDPLHPETRLDRQTVEVCAHRAVLYLEGAGRQCREAYLAAAHRPDGADHRHVRKDPAHAGGAVKTGVGEQFADYERSRVLRAELFGACGGDSQHARTQG